MDRVRIFDTTLRDGEQSPGASMTSAEKLEIARQLAILGVDIIEAGFAAASPDDLEGIRTIAEFIGEEDGPVITSLARANRNDIDQAWEAVRLAANPRIHTFLATSDLHMARKLNMSRAEVVARTGEMVAYARSLCADVEFSPEDACRSDPDFLVEVCSVAVAAGATTLNIPDTVGYIMPDEYAALMRKLISETPGGDDVIWSVHCHDDLGFATANSIAGLRAGARQAEVTMNGIGERAGNTSLEELVMALRTRASYYGLATGIDTQQLARTSQMVSRATSIEVPPNKAIVGANAFAHEAGIHQDGMLKDQRTYEIMTPETVGLDKSHLVLGKHSGRHAFRVRLEELGYHLDDERLKDAFQRFKKLADHKKTITDIDLQVLAHDEAATPDEFFELRDVQVTCGRAGMSTATVKIREGGEGSEERVAAAIGHGPIDAVFQAIRMVIRTPNRLIDYAVHSVTPGIDALGEVTVRVAPRTSEGEERTFGGHGADVDIIVASAYAYVAALNRMVAVIGQMDNDETGDVRVDGPIYAVAGA